MDFRWEGERHREEAGLGAVLVVVVPHRAAGQTRRVRKGHHVDV